MVNAGSNGKVSEYTASKFILYVRAKPQTSQGAHADPCSPLKAPTMENWTTEGGDVIW